MDNLLGRGPPQMIRESDRPRLKRLEISETASPIAPCNDVAVGNLPCQSHKREGQGLRDQTPDDPSNTVLNEEVERSNDSWDAGLPSGHTGEQRRRSLSRDSGLDRNMPKRRKNNAKILEPRSWAGSLRLAEKRSRIEYDSRKGMESVKIQPDGDYDGNSVGGDASASSLLSSVASMTSLELSDNASNASSTSGLNGTTRFTTKKRLRSKMTWAATRKQGHKDSLNRDVLRTSISGGGKPSQSRQSASASNAIESVHHVSEFHTPTLDPEKLALSTQLSNRIPLGSKPQPDGRPTVWAESRQALCETLPYYRSAMSSSYFTNGHVYAFMFDGHPHYRDYVDSDVIICRATGAMEYAGREGMLQGRDQDIGEAQMQAVLTDIALRNPVVVICGKRAVQVPSAMPHAYNVLGWYKPICVWAEKATARVEERLYATNTASSVSVHHNHARGIHQSTSKRSQVAKQISLERPTIKIVPDVIASIRRSTW